jgi:hypothetical protein
MYKLSPKDRVEKAISRIGRNKYLYPDEFNKIARSFCLKASSNPNYTEMCLYNRRCYYLGLINGKCPSFAMDYEYLEISIFNNHMVKMLENKNLSREQIPEEIKKIILLSMKETKQKYLDEERLKKDEEEKSKYTSYYSCVFDADIKKQYEIYETLIDGFITRQIRNKSAKTFYYYIFRNPVTILNECDICHKISTPKKIHERRTSVFYDRETYNNKSCLCMSCWNKAKSLEKRTKDIEELKTLTYQLKKVSRVCLK